VRTWDTERELAASAQLHRMSNWGRWGAADERGAANLADADAVARGIASVRHSRVYGLGQVLDSNASPKQVFTSAARHFMISDGGDARLNSGQEDRYSAFPGHQSAEDGLIFSIHGNTSHIDGLAHVWTEDVMFNGFSGDVVRSSGAGRLGIEKLGPIVTRGILLDVPRLWGVDRLSADDLITVDDVVACLEAAGLEVAPGDAVLVHTGWPTMYTEDPVAYSDRQPGIGASAALYLAERDIAVIAADNTAVEAWCGHDDRALADERWSHCQIHIPFLRNLGIYLIEKLDLAVLARDEVTSFLFTLAPLAIAGGTGSPVNPVAVA
jgi:kynurenine formamidase